MDVRFEFKTKLTDAPWQYDWLLIGVITGNGLTVIVPVPAEPVHVWLFVVKEGETEIIPWMGCVPELVATKLAIEPVPTEDKPIELFEFVQSKIVPGKLEVKLIWLEFPHYIMFDYW